MATFLTDMNDELRPEYQAKLTKVIEQCGANVARGFMSDAMARQAIGEHKAKLLAIQKANDEATPCPRCAGRGRLDKDLGNCRKCRGKGRIIKGKLRGRHAGLHSPAL